MTRVARERRYADLKAKGTDLVRHPVLIELLRRPIGPAFPRDEFTGSLQGMRGFERRATKTPFRYGRQRRRRSATAITVVCLSCTWTSSGRTWRPCRRRLAEHTSTKHPRLVSRPGLDDSTADLRAGARGDGRAQSGAPGKAAPAGDRGESSPRLDRGPRATPTPPTSGPIATG